MYSPDVKVPECSYEVRAQRRSMCASRGYCGPFVNEELFDHFNNGAWRGTANCIHCGSTVNVGVELERWERSLWLREFSIELSVETITGAPGRLLRNPAVQACRA
ncbi:MAG TPA: hypothetical protein VFZ18_02905 [Longimicrobiaceae bacterium]